MGEWKTFRFGDVTVNYDSRRVPVRSADRKPGKYPYYGASGIVDYVDDYLFDGEYLLVAEDGENLRTRKTPIAFVATGRFWVNNHAHIVKGNDLANTRYLGYVLERTDVAGYLSGSTQPKLTQNAMNRIELTLPERSYQDVVVTMIGALDDKIAVNERIASTSDELIRQQYLQMVGDVEDSITLGELGYLVRESVSATDLRASDNYIALEHMPRRNMWLAEWESAESVVSTKTRFIDGDVLFGKLRPYFHKVGLALTEGVCSTDILVVRPVSNYLRGWLLASLSSDDVVAHASAVGDGTRMPRAKWSDLARYDVPWVGDDRASSFNDFVTSISCQVASILAENRTLAQLRDTLLPKLMSGELRVRDAEKMVEDAT